MANYKLINYNHQMNKSTYIFALLFTASTLFISCGSEDTSTAIPVASVTLTGCFDTTPLFTGSTHQLTATIFPENATNRAVTWTSSNNNIATVDNYGLVTAHAVGTASISVITADGRRTATCVVTVVLPPNQIDEGVVINDIRWATRNLDYPGTFTPYPHSAGRFYQWGTLNDVTHHWAVIGTVTGWNRSDSRVAWTTANDPCPQGWRVPTEAELRSLNSAGSVWTQRNGVNGRLFGTAPNQIFLPAASSRFHLDGMLSGVHGDYWGSTQGGQSGLIWHLRFCNDSSGTGNTRNSANGLSVRCVAE